MVRLVVMLRGGDVMALVAPRLWGEVGAARVRAAGRVRKEARVWRVSFMTTILEVVEL